MHRRTLVLTGLLTLALPSVAFASEGEVPPGLAIGAGVAGLLVAVVLLSAMLSLKRIASGAAIAENITYAVLAVLCLTGSVLVGWLVRWMPTPFTANEAQLGADLLSIVSMVLFGIYFLRVRRAMAKYLTRLTGEEQLLTAVIDPAAATGE